MFEGELGVKADGLSVQQFLMHGVPCPQTAEAVIADIDEQLVENGAQIEECIKSLLEMTTELSGEHTFLHPVDAINHMADNQLLEKMACYNPEPDQVNKLLKHVMTALDEKPGSEEGILQHLLQLTSKEGMCLPRCTANSGVSASTLSINTASDDSEHVNQNLWNDICMKLRRYFIDKLSKLPVGGRRSERPVIRALGDERLRYLQSLCSLFPSDNIWQRYKSLRVHQLDGRLLCSKNGQTGRDTTFLRAVSHMSEELLPTLETMISEDYEVINSGVLLGGGGSGLAALQEMYSERLMEEVTSAVSSLQQEMAEGTSKQRTKDTSNTKEIAKSNSEFGFMNQFKGNLRRQQSKSLDSLLSKADDNFTDITVTPVRHVDSIVMYVEALIKLEKFLTEIFSALMWEARPKRVKSLKSALKGSQLEFKKKGLFSPRSFEQSGLLPEAIPPPFGATPAMIAQGSSSMAVLERQASIAVSWDWRPAWRSIAPQLAQCVDSHIRGTGEVATQLLDTALDTGELSTTPLARHKAGGSRDNPNAASKEVVVLCGELERLIPLTQIAASVKSSLIDSATFILKNVHVKLSKLGREVSDKYPISTHYKVLSNAVLLRNLLEHLQDALQDSTATASATSATSTAATDRELPLHGVLKQYSDLVELCTGRITEYHGQLISSSILHDAESNHWTDNKEFYENERCSFCISMWQLQLWLMREELWAVCPPRMAQDMFLTVLHDSLTTICHRYVRIHPSYRRTQQYRQDIVSVLVCVSQLLLSACSHSGHYLCPSSSERRIYAIHNCCGSMLAAMAVVCSPIDTLYRVYKKGFQKKVVRREDEELRGYMSQWLSWLHPSLLEPGHYSLDTLQTTTALYVQLRLLQAQPPASMARNATLLLQTLMMKQCTLSIMLLTQTAKASCHKEDGALEVFVALIGILLHCGGAGYPAALATTLLPVLDVNTAQEGEEESGWNILTSSSPDQQVPTWMEAVLYHLDSFLLRCIEPGIRVLLARNMAPPPVPSLLEWMEQLPCGCTPHKDNLAKGGSSSSKDILAESLYSVVSQLTEDVFVLPTPLLCLLHSIQQHATDSRDDAEQISHQCAAVKVFAVGLRRILMDTDRVQELIGQQLDDNMLDYVRMLAECLYHVLTATSYSKSSGVPRIAAQFMKANRNWLKEQIDTIVEHVNNPLFESESDRAVDLLDDASPDFLEQQLLLLANAVLTAPKGSAWLRCVHHLLENNMSWVLGQLDVLPLLPLCQPPAATFSLDTQSHAPQPTPSPLAAHNTLADFYKFDHAAIEELPWNWAALLQSDLGLTEAGFRSLLFHRHEMQDGAYLEETEMKPVQTLRNKFDAE